MSAPPKVVRSMRLFGGNFNGGSMATFEKWYSAQMNKATTVQDMKLILAAWEAGVRAGYKEAALDSRDVAAEAGWKERQGEEYGSY